MEKVILENCTLFYCQVIQADLQLDGGTSLHGPSNWRPHFLRDLYCWSYSWVVSEECRRGARTSKDPRNPLVIQVESLVSYAECTEDLLSPL